MNGYFRNTARRFNNLSDCERLPIGERQCSAVVGINNLIVEVRSLYIRVTMLVVTLKCLKRGAEVSRIPLNKAAF